MKRVASVAGFLAQTRIHIAAGFRLTTQPRTRWLIRLRRTLPTGLPKENVFFHPLPALAGLEKPLSVHGLATGIGRLKVDKTPRSFLLPRKSVFTGQQVVVFRKAPGKICGVAGIQSAGGLALQDVNPE
jgi:hypothetical protein